MATTRVLMVCLGNICRSPTAEAALREAADRVGAAIQVDSAGTSAYHIGEPPDPRMTAAATEMGLEMDSVARQVVADDFEHFDLLVALDRSNQRVLLDLAPTPEHAAKVVLFRDFTDQPGTDVPDPYYGGPDGFVEVVEIARAGAASLLASLADRDA